LVVSRERVKRAAALATPAIGGVVFGLATPPIDFFLGVPLGLLLLAHAVSQVTRFRRGALVGLLWATAAGLVGMRFVPTVITLFTDLGVVAAVAAHVLLSLAQSVWWALAMGLCVLWRRRLKSPFAVAFGLAVLVALSMPNVFVWSPAGLLSPWPLLIQLADVIGERGVSALLAFHMALIVRARQSDDHRVARGVAITALPLVVLVYGAWSMDRWRDDGGPHARIALVQAAIEPTTRWKPKNFPRILASLKEQTRKAHDVDLTIWPEAAYPYPLRHDAKHAPRDKRRRLFDGKLHAPLLFGLISMAPATRDADGQYRRDRFNSATVLTADGSLQPSYDKMELLWFGETVPGSAYLPWLRRLFQRSGGLIAGETLRSLHVELRSGSDMRLGVLNCYEDTLPQLGRRIARELAPHLLVNVTNDAWFVGTAEPQLHLRLSVMRSVELRRDMVRSVNLGVPAWIDARGVVRAQHTPRVASSLVVQPRLRSLPATTYARWGDTPLLMLLAGGAMGPWLRRRWRRRTEA
jgi:apolipoprotein N-acyltransferase